jgi:hypothetical protein
MPKYRYTNANGNPLTHCPTCGGNLTELNAVRVEFVSSHTWDDHSRLDADGVLEDPTNGVKDGLHSATFCARCNLQLIDHDGVEETDISGPPRRRSDDDEPVTEAWLVSLGYENHPVHGLWVGPARLSHYPAGDWFEIDHGRGHGAPSAYRLRTRGSVRLLLRALELIPPNGDPL